MPRIRCLTFRVVPTPAPTQGYNAVLDEMYVHAHCDPDFEHALVLASPPSRILHGLLCAFQGRKETVRGIYTTSGSRELYVKTQKTLYLCRAAHQGYDYIRFVCEPVR